MEHAKGRDRRKSDLEGSSERNDGKGSYPEQVHRPNPDQVKHPTPKHQESQQTGTNAPTYFERIQEDTGADEKTGAAHIPQHPRALVARNELQVTTEIQYPGAQAIPGPDGSVGEYTTEEPAVYETEAQVVQDDAPDREVLFHRIQQLEDRLQNQPVVSGELVGPDQQSSEPETCFGKRNMVITVILCLLFIAVIAVGVSLGILLKNENDTTPSGVSPSTPVPTTSPVVPPTATDSSPTGSPTQPSTSAPTEPPDTDPPRPAPTDPTTPPPTELPTTTPTEQATPSPGDPLLCGFDMLEETDLVGSDITTPFALNMGYDDAVLECRNICFNVARCLSFTLVGTGAHPIFINVPWCFIKDSIPNDSPAADMTSGIWNGESCSDLPSPSYSLLPSTDLLGMDITCIGISDITSLESTVDFCINVCNAMSGCEAFSAVTPEFDPIRFPLFTCCLKFGVPSYEQGTEPLIYSGIKL